MTRGVPERDGDGLASRAGTRRTTGEGSADLRNGRSPLEPKDSGVASLASPLGRSNVLGAPDGVDVPESRPVGLAG